MKFGKLLLVYKICDLMIIKIHVGVFWGHCCGLVGGSHVLEEYNSYIFRVEVAQKIEAVRFSKIFNIT
jgi:hypothetical protein